MTIVLHLMPASEWQRLGPTDSITNPSLAGEGFIHCTDEPAVMLKVANAFYADGDDDFVVVHVDVSRLSSDCVWEEPAHISDTAESFAPSFPHVFGPIDRSAVVAVQPVLRDPNGRFVGYGDAVPST